MINKLVKLVGVYLVGEGSFSGYLVLERCLGAVKQGNEKKDW